MAIIKPSRGDLAGDRLLIILQNFYESIIELFRLQAPSMQPALKCITSPTHADARLHIGDYAGNAGPRAMIVTGKAAPLDGGQGIYAWDATSVALDDDANTLQPFAIPFGKPGRWRKGGF